MPYIKLQVADLLSWTFLVVCLYQSAGGIFKMDNSALQSNIKGRSGSFDLPIPLQTPSLSIDSIPKDSSKEVDEVKTKDEILFAESKETWSNKGNEFLQALDHEKKIVSTSYTEFPEMLDLKQGQNISDISELSIDFLNPDIGVKKKDTISSGSFDHILDLNSVASRSIDGLQTLPEIKEAKDLQKLSSTDFYHLISSQIEDIDAYTVLRYPEDNNIDAFSGEKILNGLSSLGDQFKVLSVDPGLCSPKHLEGFIGFVQEKDLKDPWEARKAYSQALGNITVYRGVKVTEEVKENIITNGFQASATRNNQIDLGTLFAKSMLPDQKGYLRSNSEIMLSHLRGVNLVPSREQIAAPKRTGNTVEYKGEKTTYKTSPQAIKEHAQLNKQHAEAKKQNAKLCKDQDLFHSVTQIKEVAQAVSSNSDMTGVESGNVYIFTLKLPILDMIDPSDYVNKQELPINQLVIDNEVIDGEFPTDGAVESLVIPGISSQHIQACQLYEGPPVSLKDTREFK